MIFPNVRLASFTGCTIVNRSKETFCASQNSSLGSCRALSKERHLNINNLARIRSNTNRRTPPVIELFWGYHRRPIRDLIESDLFLRRNSTRILNMWNIIEYFRCTSRIVSALNTPGSSIDSWLHHHSRIFSFSAAVITMFHFADHGLQKCFLRFATRHKIVSKTSMSSLCYKVCISYLLGTNHTNVRQFWTCLGIDKCYLSSLPITEQMFSIQSAHIKVQVSKIN